MPKQAITNFSKGEFGPELYGRVDVPQYAAGAKQLRNFIIQRYGGVKFRPGFQFVAEVDDVDVDYRLLPFQYSIDQAYVMVLGEQSMRLAANGGLILEDDLQIVSMTADTAATLEVPFHDYVVGDRVYFSGNTDIPELNYRFAVVTAVPDEHHVTVDVDSRNFSDLVSSTGIVRTEAPAPPEPTDLPDPVTPVDDPPATAGPGADLGGSGGGTGPGTWDSGGLVRPHSA